MDTKYKNKSQELASLVEYMKNKLPEKVVKKELTNIFKVSVSQLLNNPTSSTARKYLKNYKSVDHSLYEILDKGIISKYHNILKYLKGDIFEEMISMGQMPNAVAADITVKLEKSIEKLSHESSKDAAILSTALISKQKNTLTDNQIKLFFDLLSTNGFSILKSIIAL